MALHSAWPCVVAILYGLSDLTADEENVVCLASIRGTAQGRGHPRCIVLSQAECAKSSSTQIHRLLQSDRHPKHLGNQYRKSWKNHRSKSMVHSVIRFTHTVIIDVVLAECPRGVKLERQVCTPSSSAKLPMYLEEITPQMNTPSQ